MIKENRFIYFEVVPSYRRRKGKGMEVYRPPKEFKETLPGKLEKIEKEMSQTEAQKVLEKLDEYGEMKCEKCSSKTITEDDSDPKFYKFLCFDCGHKWQLEKNGPKN